MNLLILSALAFFFSHAAVKLYMEASETHKHRRDLKSQMELIPLGKARTAMAVHVVHLRNSYGQSVIAFTMSLLIACSLYGMIFHELVDMGLL